MRVFITGGTGLVGRALVQVLRERGDEPVVLTRHADRARLNPAMKGVEIVQGDPSVAGAWQMAVDGCETVVNLAGHNIFAKRWNPEVKREILDSRVFSTENIVAAIGQARTRPKLLISASAIGYYGPHGDEEITESSPPADDYMARVCVAWEQAAMAAEPLGTHLVILRIGIVLDRNDGALKAMLPIFKLGFGSPVGSGGVLGPARGRQWMSWIHRKDLIGLITLAMDNAQARGPINATAPNPVRNADFSRALAKAVHRWVMPVGPPDLLLKGLLGEVAQVLTGGQRVLPRRALALGYQFRFPDLDSALADLFARPRTVASRADTSPVAGSAR